MDETLTTLSESGDTLNLKKCRLFRDSVDYLGHIIKTGRLDIDNLHTRRLKDAKTPTNLPALRSFLFLCNISRHFIPAFTDIAHLLNRKYVREDQKTSNLTKNSSNPLRHLSKRSVIRPFLLYRAQLAIFSRCKRFIVCNRLYHVSNI